ncbi:MAG: dihydroneopterin aldolase [Chthoniobacterales bacterium]
MERIIQIKSLIVMTSIGISKEEQAMPQQLLCDLCFAALSQPQDLNDHLAETIDYAAVSQRVQDIARERPRKLIETLADELSRILLNEFHLQWIELTIRKFILPDTEYVAVTVRRDAR